MTSIPERWEDFDPDYRPPTKPENNYNKETKTDGLVQ